MLEWLLGAGLGPAVVALPVNWAADMLADAARRWFRRLRRTDDLSRLVKAATGISVDLTEAEFTAVRELLEDPHTWDVVGGGSVDDLADQIAERLQPRGDRTVEGSHAAALVIARGLLEFAVADLDPRLFQQVLLARLQRMESDQARALDYALLGLHGRFGSVMEQFKLVLERLPPGSADHAEIAVYLRTLIDWLSIDPWPRDFGASALTPTAVERKLLIAFTDQVEEEGVDADWLAQQCMRLVILGGPGSGKTWLARRIARRSAEAALDALAKGGRLDDVELPLYTTSSRLFRAGGDIREAIISSALNQIGDLGGSRIKVAVSEFFVERNSAVLLVVDALDEAHGSSERLQQADTLPWRIVLTSRPSAWRNQLTIDETDESRRVGELQPLRYPDDVTPFIRQWFGERPEGSDLAGQIALRPDIQQAVTVPLILAFCCIVGSSGPLPEFRRDLYTKVLRRMLTGRWRDDDERDVDADACLEVLRTWAWSGAINDPVSGVGAWDDDIPTERVWLDESHRDAIDHIAAPSGPRDFDNGKIVRRFIHRSVREHFVAEYVAGLPADEAVEVLLPHLWYDPDWEYAAPAAIAMHPDHDQLLKKLICYAAGMDRFPVDMSVIDARWEFRSFLARLASESSEPDWSPVTAAMIGQARVDLTHARYFEDLGGASRWQISTSQAWEVLLASLTSEADGRVGLQVVDGLVQLAVRADEKRQTREAMLGLLASHTDPWMAARLVDGLVQLAVGAEEKRQTREAMLGLLASHTGGQLAPVVANGLAQLDLEPREKRQTREILMALLTSHTDSEVATRLIHQLLQIDPGPEEKDRACQILLALLSDRPGWMAADLVDGLVQLAVGAEEKRQTREAMLGLLASHTGGQLAPVVADGLAQLDPGPEEKRQAREALLSVLAAQTDGLLAAVVADRLAQLDPGPEEKRQAREALLSLLAAQTGTFMVAELVDRLARLDWGPEEKRQARDALLGLLANCNDGRLAAGLAEELTRFDWGPEEKRQARDALLGLLANCNDGRLATELADGLTRFDPGPEEKRQARDALLGLLSHVKSWMAEGLVDRVVRLTSTPEEKRQVCGDLLSLLARQTGSRIAADLASGVALVDPGPEEKRQGREFLLAILTRQNGGRAAARLIDPLIQLDPGEEERRQACDATLRLLAKQTNSKTAARLVHSLVKLTLDTEERFRVREALLAMLASQSDSQVAAQLVDGLTQLAPVAHDLNNWRAWAILPPVELLAAVRENSTLANWLSVILSLASLSAERGSLKPEPRRGFGENKC